MKSRLLPILALPFVMGACSTTNGGPAPSSPIQNTEPPQRDWYAPPDRDSPISSSYQNQLDSRESEYRQLREAVYQRSREIYSGSDSQKRQTADIQAAREIDPEGQLSRR